MKKSFLTTSKKVLLATSVLAMSSTAIANTSPSMDNQTLVKDSLSVIAKYITPITVGLNLTEIDFGDVYTDSVVTVTDVAADVQGEAGETFTYSIATTTNGKAGLVLIAGTDTGGNTQEFLADGSTALELNFTVGLDTAQLTADTDVSETVTFTVYYDAIADTSSSANGAYDAPVTDV
jgi:hypothetical protein